MALEVSSASTRSTVSRARARVTARVAHPILHRGNGVPEPQARFRLNGKEILTAVTTETEGRMLHQ